MSFTVAILLCCCVGSIYRQLSFHQHPDPALLFTAPHSTAGHIDKVKLPKGESGNLRKDAENLGKILLTLPPIWCLMAAHLIFDHSH